MFGSGEGVQSDLDDDEVLLLQLGSDSDGPRFECWDLGAICFWMKKEALRAHQFHRLRPRSKVTKRSNDCPSLNRQPLSLGVLRRSLEANSYVYTLPRSFCLSLQQALTPSPLADNSPCRRRVAGSDRELRGLRETDMPGRADLEW
ncbi:DUF1963 domain-containing protein [Rhizobium ruizarguesonis]